MDLPASRDDERSFERREPRFPIVSVSIPRSGHHMLMNLLRDVFGETFTYCVFYAGSPCCQTIPCTRPVSIQKSHDFELDQPIDNKLLYIVEYRNFVSSTISDYKMFASNNGADCRSLWLNFAFLRMEYYTRFLEKWALEERGNVLCVNYDEVMINPVQQIRRVIDFTGLQAENEPADVLVNYPVGRKNNDEEFKYYDPEIFALFEHLLTPYYEKLYMRKRYDRKAYFRIRTRSYAQKTEPLIREMRSIVAQTRASVLAERNIALQERDAAVAVRDAAAEREANTRRWAERAFRRPETALYASMSYRIHKWLAKQPILGPETRRRFAKAAGKRKLF